MESVKKPAQPVYNVSFRIVADISKDIPGSSIEEALETASAYNLDDILDLSAVYHNDSEKPEITGLYRVGA